MIEEIRIRDLGVIAGAHLELSPGLNVLTGETGAGKTMVLTGLSLLLGGRADAAQVRRGAERALVEGVVGNPPAAVVERAREAGADLDDGALLLARSVPAQGRARAYLGGRAVPQAVLAELSADLVTVHGQADQLRLRVPAQQRAAVDAFAGPEHLALLERYRAVWAELGRARAALGEWDGREQAHQVELAGLRAALAALEVVAPRPGEDHLLRVESERLGHVEEIRAAVEAARAAIVGDEAGGPESGAVETIAAARRILDRAAHADPALAAWAERLAELAYLASDLGVELASHLADLEADPARLAAVQERRAAIGDLVRRYAPAGPGGPAALDDLLAWAERARRRVGELTDPGRSRARLAEEVTRSEGELRALAEVLSEARDGAARGLRAAVTAELAALAMAGARLEVELARLPEPGPNGAEDVEFRLVAHRGAPAVPLGRGASGGELSRVMLALEVALATAPGAPARPTFVFDEVDAGVGGRAAVEVGRRLARLARGAQVLVVTHLAQVAAFADRHLVVTKNTPDDDTVTESGVRAVRDGERVSELARMLSGDPDSDVALRHAADLLRRADVGP